MDKSELYIALKDFYHGGGHFMKGHIYELHPVGAGSFFYVNFNQYRAYLGSIIVEKNMRKFC